MAGIRCAIIIVVFAFIGRSGWASATTGPSVEWVRPDGSVRGLALWGIRGGMAVGLSPLRGPRGLIRVYAPYLRQPALRVINFIAVEPVVNGVRGLSELETSHLDGKQGLRMWTSDRVDLEKPPGDSGVPARGVVEDEGHRKALSVWVCVERYDNGARCVVKITFHSDRPHEVCLAAFAAKDSRPIKACVLTATVGNYARLRHLHLRDRTVEAVDLFRGAALNSWGFFDWHTFGAGELDRRDAELCVWVTGDIDSATPDGVPNGVPRGWRYVGLPAVQSWSTEWGADVTVRVNGRATFWRTEVAVPGGPAFENFELYCPFEQGRTFRFGVEPEAAQ